jgi:hypothetical protein
VETLAVASRGVIAAIARDAEAAGAPLRRVGDAFGRSVAVVLGINAYGGGIRPLATAVPDAEAIAERLAVDHGFAVLLRRDGEVTAGGVRAVFERELAALPGGALPERPPLIL